MRPEDFYFPLALAAVGSPAGGFGVLSAMVLAGRNPSERLVSFVVESSLAATVVATVLLAGLWMAGDSAVTSLVVGDWFGRGSHAFRIDFELDRLSMSVLPVAMAVTLLVARFAVPYLHREEGFTRFFLQILLFAAGISTVILAGSADMLVIGWECIGIASALLVGFFHERPEPVHGALRVFASYRLCDVGLLVGAMLLHLHAGTADFPHAFHVSNWPGNPATLPTATANGIALAFAVAAIGKSAQLPVGSWLPRAMEGPTPSSALFYGGPAVHAGVYLLLRVAPLLQEAAIISWLLVAVGLATAVHATVVCQVQVDRKSVLAYASMTQLGLMVAECGAGWFEVARLHLLAHVCLRTWQLLRVPSAFRDAHSLRATNAGRPLPVPELARPRVPEALRVWAYHLGLERTHVDHILERWVLAPLFSLGKAADQFERWSLARLSGGTWPASTTASSDRRPQP